MKSRSGAFALLLPLTLAGAGSALATDAGAATCSEATLSGTYLFAHEGFTVSGKGQGPFAIAGQDVFDGHGKQRGVITVSANGKITRYIHSTGKYTVNPDCTGSVSFSDGTTGDLFVAPDGSQLVFVQTNPGNVRAGSEQRVTARRVGG
jgi:hypothetical protein